MTSLDLVVKNVRVVRPRSPTVERLDLGVKDGRFALLAPEIPATEARNVFDGRGLLAFPGVVDAHTHAGIYGPLADDAATESKAAASGGVTTMLTYFRTGRYYRTAAARGATSSPTCSRSRTVGTGAITAITWRPSRAVTSMRWRGSPSSTASRRSRSSCSTAATACTGKPTAMRSAASSCSARRLVRPRPLRVRHALGEAALRDTSRAGRARERQPALRDGRHPQRLHEARSA